jgi:hypothetical protein
MAKKLTAAINDGQPFIKVRIVKCSDANFWYASKVGDNIFVRNTAWNGAYYEAKNGSSVLKADCQPIKKS